MAQCPPVSPWDAPAGPATPFAQAESAAPIGGTSAGVHPLMEDIGLELMAEPPLESPWAALEPVSGSVPDAPGVVGEPLDQDSVLQGPLIWARLVAGGSA